MELDAGGSRALVKQKWLKWRGEAFATDAVYAKMDALMAQLVDSGAMARETERWPNGNADEDMTFMKDFTAKRLEFLDAYVEELAK